MTYALDTAIKQNKKRNIIAIFQRCLIEFDSGFQTTQFIVQFFGEFRKTTGEQFHTIPNYCACN